MSESVPWRMANAHDTGQSWGETATISKASNSAPAADRLPNRGELSALHQKGAPWSTTQDSGEPARQPATTGLIPCQQDDKQRSRSLLQITTYMSSGNHTRLYTARAHQVRDASTSCERAQAPKAHLIESRSGRHQYLQATSIMPLRLPWLVRGAPGQRRSSATPLCRALL